MRDIEIAFTETDTCKGTSKEEILQQSLFKKTIDATLLRTEMRKLYRCMGSVGILYWNNFVCGAVFRIGSNFILTCWHVIEPIVLPAGKIDHWGKASVAMDFESLKNKDIVNVGFNSEDKRSDRCRFGFKPKACFLDKKMDICILELDADQKGLPVPIDFFRDIQSIGTSEEEILQQSLFKKTVDATLLRTDMRKLYRCMGSVGILYWNNFGCGTVVRIGSNFILACWHVIKPIVLPAGKIDHWGKASVAMDFESLKNKDIVNVDFNSEDKRSDRCRFGFKPKACFLDEKMDICILELDADQKDLPVPIDCFRDIQSIGMKTAKRFVHVIGQHPDKSRIVLDTGCKIILPDDEKVKSAKKWIKENKQIILRHGPTEKHIMESYDEVFATNQHLILDTFLEFGASGGAVVTITPDGKVALVAILMRGLPRWFWNKRSQECGFPSELRMEVGCLISQILGSNEWIESERNRIFGSAVETEVNEGMDTDEHEIYIQPRSGRASYRRNEEVIDMDTDQGEEEAVDNERTRLTLQNTC